jgi:hypothetical protein
MPQLVAALWARDQQLGIAGAVENVALAECSRGKSTECHRLR